MGRQNRRRKAGAPEPLDVRQWVAEAIVEDGIELPEALLGDAGRPLGAGLAKLCAFDLDPAISRAAAVILQHTVHEVEGSEEVAQGAAAVLLEALRNPHLPDERKQVLAPLFVLCGGEASAETMASFFKDFAGTVERAVASITESMTDGPESVADLFVNLDFVTEDDAEPPTDEAYGSVAAFARRLVTTKPAVAASTLGAAIPIAVEHGLHTEITEFALETLAESHCAQAAWCLDELGRWPGIGPPGSQARLLSRKLVLDGVTPECPTHGRFQEGRVSEVDGDGTRCLFLAFERPDHGLDVVMLLINDAAGIKSVSFHFGNGEEILQGAAEDEAGFLHAPCSVGLARELVADALAIHEAEEQPPPGRLFLARMVLGREPIVPRRRRPDLSAYPLDRGALPPDLAESPTVFASHPSISNLLFTSPAAYDFLARTAPPKARHLSRKKFTAYLRQVLPAEREAFLARAAANLETQALAGLAREPVNRRAALLLHALQQGEVPFHEHPSIHRLCKESIGMVIDNLRLGYRNQQEANDAAMEFEDRLDEVLDSDMESLSQLLTEDGLDDPFTEDDGD